MSFLDRERVYVVAEVGSNHRQRLEAAIALIHAAAAAGADAVKFQMFRADTMYERNSDGWLTAKQWELDEHWLPDLAGACSDRGVDFLCSVFDGETAAVVDPLVRAHKIASLELTWDSLLRNVAQRGKPILLSTGAATLEQIAWALGVIRGEAPDLEVVLMQCVCAYPAPLEESNLLALISMSAKFGVRVGLSDHTRTPWKAPMIATALGAPVIEKHIRLDRTPAPEGEVPPDFWHAIDPTEFNDMVIAIRETEAALGDGRKRVMPSEEGLRSLQRGPRGLRGA